MLDGGFSKTRLQSPIGRTYSGAKEKSRGDGRDGSKQNKKQ